MDQVEVFGELLKNHLDACGMTQAELARQMGVTRAVISQYLSGELSPSADRVTMMADSLQLTGDLRVEFEIEAHLMRLPPRIQTMIRSRMIGVTGDAGDR